MYYCKALWSLSIFTGAWSCFSKGTLDFYSGLQIYHGLSSGEMRREDMRGKSRASLDLRARLIGDGGPKLIQHRPNQ